MPTALLEVLVVVSGKSATPHSVQTLSSTSFSSATLSPISAKVPISPLAQEDTATTQSSMEEAQGEALSSSFHATNSSLSLP